MFNDIYRERSYSSSNNGEKGNKGCKIAGSIPLRMRGVINFGDT